MGTAQSQETLEKPSENHSATLYYFAGRGLADQIRWVLAATEVSFTQKTITSREQLLKMKQRQLPFGQLPLVQIDGLELVETQAIVRFLARRANIQGATPEDQVKCDMIAEAVLELLKLACDAPFCRVESTEALEAHHAKMRARWQYLGTRFEAILLANNKEFLVGQSLSYSDILVAHIMTWFVEECGSDIVEKMPLLVNLQNKIISLPGIQSFIKSVRYFPIGGQPYVEQVNMILGR